MAEEQSEGLKIVDAFDLDDELRSLLRPGEMIKDLKGRRHRLPRYFYEVPSHEEARNTRLAVHFGLNEFVQVDLREAPRLQNFPRYVPCAVRILAFFLQRVREVTGTSVHVAVNGGYRSPAHKMAMQGPSHMWGTAVDLYKIGQTILDDTQSIARYSKVLEDISEEFWVAPYGHEPGVTTDDHIHLDLGYISLVPREISEDRMEIPQQKPRFAFEERRRIERIDRRLSPTSPTLPPLSETPEQS